MTRPTRGLGALTSGVAAALILSGCSMSVAEMPLPGGTDAGEDPMLVKAEFADVLDLVPQSTVKINDVSVGMITDVELDGETAVVTMELPQDTELPDNALAEIRQTSLLGEKFVSLSPPETGAEGELGHGDVIGLDHTGRNPEVEEVLGALSLLLNGGGLAQMKTIAHELNLALGGREPEVKSALRQIEELMAGLDDGKADIVRAIEGLNRLSLSVSDQIGTIDAALEELPSALRTIDQQRADLVQMLRALNDLSGVGVEVIRQSKAATIESFRQLVPVLTKFADSGDAFVDAFHVFLTYPFVDEVVGRDPQVARNLHMGDYTNLSVTLDITLEDDGSINPPGELPDCTSLKELRKEFDKLPDGPLSDLVNALPDLGELCKGARDAVQDCLDKSPAKAATCLENKLDVIIDEVTGPLAGPVCKQFPALCSLTGTGGNQGGGGTLGGVTGGLGGGGKGGGGNGGGGGSGDGPLGGLTGGLPRPGFDPQPRDAGRQGPTMGQLMAVYDPDLVQLLVPGMVTR